MNQIAQISSCKAQRIGRRATLHRMVMDKHICPFGLKSRHLLHQQGYEVDDRWLTTREQTDAFVSLTENLMMVAMAIWMLVR